LDPPADEYVDRERSAVVRAIVVDPASLVRQEVARSMSALQLQCGASHVRGYVSVSYRISESRVFPEPLFFGGKEFGLTQAAQRAPIDASV
jgi:hypothetical protein